MLLKTILRKRLILLKIFSSVDGNCIPHNDEGQELTSIPNINVIFEPEEGASGSQGEAINTYRVPSAFTYYKTDNGVKSPVFTKGFWIKKYPEYKSASEYKLFDFSSDQEIIFYAGILLQRSNHIIRNSQWGAVAYLAYSKYGLGTDTADSTTGNETGVYYMNHFNNIENPNYSRKTGELTVYTKTSDSSFYDESIFPIDKKTESWKVAENGGDAMCETNIKKISWDFKEKTENVTFNKKQVNIINYFFIRGYNFNLNDNGVFTFQETTPNDISDYYVRDVYENILN